LSCQFKSLRTFKKDAGLPTSATRCLQDLEQREEKINSQALLLDSWF